MGARRGQGNVEDAVLAVMMTPSDRVSIYILSQIRGLPGHDATSPRSTRAACEAYKGHFRPRAT